MSILTHPWEQSLLNLALTESHQHINHESGSSLADPDLLDRSYRYCEELTAVHSRSFYLSSRLLPEGKRRAVRALYAFCRVTDDVVDKPQGDVRDELELWRERAMSNPPPLNDPVAIAWTDARIRYRIPQHYAEQLLNGVARDLTQSRYETFDDLAAYAYGVASTVGLMSMHITGYKGPAAIPYAVKLGVALQITNILRDVADDWRAGRVYLPQQELRMFDLDESDIASGQVTDRWRAFMRFQIDRNRELYQEAWPGIGLLHPEGRVAIGAAADLYRAILDDIEAHDYDVFNRRAYIGSWAKIRRLPHIWWRSRRASPSSSTAFLPA
jgi:15-cis-phytoene synthase